MLCYELKEANDKKDKKFNDKVSKFPRFMMDNFDTELVVMGIKMALIRSPSLIPIRSNALMSSTKNTASILLSHRVLTKVLSRAS